MHNTKEKVIYKVYFESFTPERRIFFIFFAGAILLLGIAAMVKAGFNYDL